MLIVSDVHGASEALGRIAKTGEPLVVLGDLINLIDYRTHEGIVADVVGLDLVKQVAHLRLGRRRAEANDLWSASVDPRREAVNEEMIRLTKDEYRRIAEALDGSEAYVTYGNVDQPDLLRSMLPPSARYLDGETIEIDGHLVGFAGGGIPRIGTKGEVQPEEMDEKLQKLGPVDILFTHVPPDVPELASDVVGRTRKGSPEILRYILKHRPKFHYFGDIHQPRATHWQVGDTQCINAGYFRATGRAVRHG